MGNDGTLISVKNVNTAIENFIGKHPENVTAWVDGKRVLIQISNVGVRDKIFSDISYLVKNTTIEFNLSIFDMPAHCVYASNSVIRFVCTITELDQYVKSNSSILISPDQKTTPPIKKFISRIVSSKAFARIKSIISKTNGKTNEDSKITVYIIGKPVAHWQDEDGNSCSYITWEVLDIIQIDAGTTWENETFIESLNNLKESLGINSDIGDYGAFNIAFNSSDNVKIENNVLIKKLPEFVLDPSIKVGDIIDSRDYVDEDIWSDWNYQTVDYDYQQYFKFSDKQLEMKGIEVKPYRETLIPDGAIITI